MLWGNEASVLVGDFLLGQAFKMMVEVGSLKALEILSSAAAVIAEGEVMQLAAAKNTATTEDEYIAVIRAKTAELFAAACEVGPALSGRQKAEQAASRSFGMNLGIAFQLVDDALDYGGVSSRLGKNIGDDFREGKITLPVVLAFRRGSDAEREFWRRTLERGETADVDLDRLRADRLRTNSFGDAHEYVQMRREFRRVSFAATYESRLDAMVYSSGSTVRPDISGPGTWAFLPARLSSGETVAVDAGFVPNTMQDRDMQDRAVAQLITGKPVAMTGYIRFPVTAGVLTPNVEHDKRMWFARDHLEMAQLLKERDITFELIAPVNDIVSKLGYLFGCGWIDFNQPDFLGQVLRADAAGLHQLLERRIV